MLIALQYFMQMAIRIDGRIPCRNFSTIMIYSKTKIFALHISQLKIAFFLTADYLNIFFLP